MKISSQRKNFEGDIRPCYVCKEDITVTKQMMRNGTYSCNKCRSKQSVASAKKNIERRRASNNAWSAKNSGNRAEATAKWRANHPEKVSSHRAVQSAIRSGVLLKEPCSVCGETKRIHGHHDDYSKPLDVIWLCHTHHMDRHQMLKERNK